MQDGTVIAVSHFINPHLFWYHSVHDFRELTEVEQQLQTISTGKHFAYHPKVAEKVAVNFVAWNKIVRAKVLCEAKWLNEFIVWALDYGFPFRTKKQYIFRLPPEMMGEIDHIRRGGLANIMPSKSEYDYIEDKVVTVTKDNWEQKACDILEKLLTDAASITFVEEFQSKDDHRWGNLIVVNHMGRAFSAREHLLSAKLALEFPKFQGIALKLKTINIQPQLSNSGKLTMRTNTSKDNMANFFSTQRSGRGADDFAKNKVEEWRVRNKHENNIIDAMSKNSIGEKKHVISTGNKESMQFTQQLSNNGELTKGTSTISVSSIDLFPSLSPRLPVGNFGKDKVEDWRVHNKCESNIVRAISKSVEVKTQAISTDNNESMQSAEQSTNMSYIGSTINKQDKEEDMPANFMSTINTNKLNSVKMENMSISLGSSIGFPCFKKMSQEDSNKNFSSPYDELTIVPAGFDVTRLNTYRNEETHWHRKKTTRTNNDALVISSKKPEKTGEPTKQTPGNMELRRAFYIGY
uniref:Tudor domain-containing protein n=1 Tax=Glossina palpalis gambiensis TaxID=67801 RepID=A0A1B0B915_9MUSC